MNLQSLSSLLLATPNRGSVHVFLGHPLADLCDVTTVEPGNTYSPGVWTCGLSFGLIVDNQVYLPDLLPAEAIEWGFGGGNDGRPPSLRAVYQAGGVTVTHELCHLGGEGAEGVDFNRLRLCLSSASATTPPQSATAFIAVKETGPAGGALKSLEWLPVESALLINGALRLVVETPQLDCQIFTGADGAGPLAMLSTELALALGEPVELRFKTEHGFADRTFAAAIPRQQPHAGLAVADGFSRAAAEWEEALPARLFAPDPRIAQVWELSAYHILAAMELGLPRIGAVNYPVFWLRDGIIILRALDLIGRADLARLGCDYMAALDFSGGFGAESDAPGEGLWTLANHARLHPDPAWLREIFPHLRRRVGWLQRMRAADRPLRAMVENRTAPTYNTPASTILCLPAQNGCIHGRMDWHSPDFYINCWAIAGLHHAAWAAGQLGEATLAQAWQAEADDLERAVYTYLLPAYGNERDPVVAPYPTGALAGAPYRDDLKAQFLAWYRANRLDPDGRRQREPLWTYFEAAQAHNALLLGCLPEAWTCISGLLDDACSPWNIAAWIEGPPGGGEGLPFRNSIGARGWLHPQHAWGGNMPHNWTSGEVLALLRSLFVVEQDGVLVLGLGAPPAWLLPGSRFGVQNLPTEYGPVSYTVAIGSDGKPELDYQGPANYRLGFVRA